MAPPVILHENSPLTRVGVVGGGVEGANGSIGAKHGVEGSTSMGRLQGGSGGLHGHCGTWGKGCVN